VGGIGRLQIRRPAPRAYLGAVTALLTGALLAGVPAPPAFASSMSWSRPVRVDSVHIHGHTYGASLAGLSCPSVSLCVALDYLGNAVSSANPGAGARATWRRKNVEKYHPGRFFTDLSCPSVSLCVAVDEAGNTVSSLNPAAGVSATWTTKRVDRSPLYGISCPSVTLCAAVDKDGNVLTSTNPTAGPAAGWTASPVEPGITWAVVSCAAEALCVLGNSSGNVVSSTEPGAGPSAVWGTQNVDGNPFAGHGAPLHAISCPAVSLCVAGDGEGNILSSNDPGDGPSAGWTKKNILGHFSHGYYPAFEGLSCPSASLCVGIGNSGIVDKAVTSTDPAAGRKAAWTVHVLDRKGEMRYLSCASTSLCVAAGTAGNVVVGTG